MPQWLCKRMQQKMGMMKCMCEGTHGQSLPQRFRTTGASEDAACVAHVAAFDPAVGHKASRRLHLHTAGLLALT
jgi:hypothetical protein